MVGAHSPADLEPVDPRKHEVEHDQVRRRIANCPEGGRSVGYRDDRVASPLEVADNDLGHRGVVIDDEDVRHDYEV
jgi:hypothetical protein